MRATCSGGSASPSRGAAMSCLVRVRVRVWVRVRVRVGVRPDGVPLHEAAADAVGLDVDVHALRAAEEELDARVLVHGAVRRRVPRHHPAIPHGEAQVHRLAVHVKRSYVENKAAPQAALSAGSHLRLPGLPRLRPGSAFTSWVAGQRWPAIDRGALCTLSPAGGRCSPSGSAR